MAANSKKDNFILIAHNIRSLYNVGSLFRTCDGAGVKKLILSGYTGYPPRQKISKVALGAEESVPFERVKNIGPYIKKLKKQGYQVLGLETGKDGQNIFQYKPKFPLALIIGNEKRGLSKAVLKLTHKQIFIPMYGKKMSLNVAVAAGVGIYEILRN